MKNILITGAGGFIGRNLSERLREDYNIYACKRADLNLLDGNKVEKYFSENKVDIVIHCANIGGSRKNAYDIGASDIVQDNLKMFFNLERCVKGNMRMISFGSGAEYDKRNELRKVKEEEFDRDVPEDSYGYSKYCISKYIMKSENIVNLRIFGLYGRYEDYSFKFISNAIVKNLFGFPIFINQNVLFDYLYIDDLVNIVEWFFNNKTADRIFNLTPDLSIDLVTISEIINSVSESKSEIILKNDGLNKEYTGNNKLLLKSMGGYRFTSYEKGINELYKYYKAHIKEIDIEKIKEDEFLRYCKTSKS